MLGWILPINKNVHSSWTLQEFTPTVKKRYGNLSPSKVVTFLYVGTCLWVLDVKHSQYWIIKYYSQIYYFCHFTIGQREEITCGNHHSTPQEGNFSQGFAAPIRGGSKEYPDPARIFGKIERKDQNVQETIGGTRTNFQF